MKIYNKGVYLVLELSAEQFDKITLYLIKGSDAEKKYLLGNPKERAYLAETLDVQESELDCANDYFKLLREPVDVVNIHCVLPQKAPEEITGAPQMYVNQDDKVVYYRDATCPHWLPATKEDVVTYQAHANYDARVQHERLAQITFVDACVAGLADPASVDYAVNTWHSNPLQTRTLRQFLGLSVLEYELWIKNPSYIAVIVDTKKTLLRIANG